MSLDLLATAPRGLGELLADELRALGAASVRLSGPEVRFRGSLETGLRVCLWSRVASRVVVVLARVPAGDADALYEGAGAVRWAEHLAPDGTLAVDCVLGRTSIRHSRHALLRVKDAIVDQLRTARGVRPSIDRRHPGLRVHVRVDRGEAAIGIDLAGEPLDRRGYRHAGGTAPLRENVAAGAVLRAGWDRHVVAGDAFLDPMCGSGTIAIEAALIAADAAPGLGRAHWGFARWPGRDEGAWRRLVAEARERRATGREHVPPVAGRDADAAAIRDARANAHRAGVAGVASFERGDVREATPAAPVGLVVTNPPWGERLCGSDLPALYAALGDTLKLRFAGWEAAVLASDPDLVASLGLRAHRSHRLWNGAAEIRLSRYRIGPLRG